MPLAPGRLLRPLSLWLLLTSAALAQSGRLGGTVTEAGTGRALADVNFLLEETGRGAVSDADGRFSFRAVPAGTYTLRASSVGFETVRQPVEVGEGAATVLAVVLVPTDARIGEVVVEGRAANLVGVATAASEGEVGQDQLALRPLARVGEVLETIPGTIVTQHSGSGKANQFFLRGFNLDHGTDFAASLDGVPMNLPTHAHGQGYLDLNGLIPELVETVHFEKGPQDAAAGDFATAGRAQIRYARRLDAGLARAEGGVHNEAGLLLAVSPRVGRADVLVAARARYADGPWANPENSALVSAVAKVSTGTAANGLSLTGMAYATRWDATDQIARRAVPGLVSRLGTLDATDGGSTGRYTLAGTWRQSAAAGRTTATAYAAYYHLDLFSNFTYFLDDPVNGDQFEQADRRVYGGADVAHEWFAPAFAEGSTTTLGGSLRHDQILGVGLFRTVGRERLATVREDEVAETTGGAYLQNETRWTPWARTLLGLRADAFRFDVASDRTENSGERTAALVSPKAGLALGPWAQTEVYVNAGLGFHSNDARGTVIAVDPASGDPVEPVDPLVRTQGAEVGIRTAAVPGLQSTVALWTIALGSELVFVGDAGGTEPSDASRHTGVEWTNHYEPMDGLQVTLDVALTRSRFTEGEDVQIENSIGRIITGGVVAGRPEGWVASLQVRHLGPRPLTGDGSVTSQAATLVNARLGRRVGPVGLALDVLNVLDSHAADVSYLYTSRLTGEPAAGVEDVHFHPVAPRTARLSATVRF